MGAGEGRGRLGDALGFCRVDPQVPARHLGGHRLAAWGRGEREFGQRFLLVDCRVVFFAEVVVGADIAGLLSADPFLGEGEHDAVLDLFPAAGVDGVGDVGVEAGASLGIFLGAVIEQLDSALVAVPGAEMVLGAAFGAAIGELAAGHGDERAAKSLDDLEIADDETLIEGDRAEGEQALLGVIHQLDADLGDFHGVVPSRGCHPCRGGWCRPAAAVAWEVRLSNRARHPEGG